jgi:hypothetical protein
VGTYGGLVSDSADPDRLYVARVAYDPHADVSQTAPNLYTVMTSVISMTRDAGITWTDLASQQMGLITHLALGPDRNSLFTATNQGVWRLDLSQAP